MTINGSKMDVFAFTIYLPDECSSKFRIFHDLAELFGLEFNEQAAKKLKKLLKKGPNDPGAKLSMDREADYVSLRASKADVMGLTVRLINETSRPRTMTESMTLSHHGSVQNPNLGQWVMSSPSNSRMAHWVLVR